MIRRISKQLGHKQYYPKFYIHLTELHIEKIHCKQTKSKVFIQGMGLSGVAIQTSIIFSVITKNKIMKKLKLNPKNFDEILTRDQLIQIVGGAGSSNCDGVGDRTVCCAEGKGAGDTGTCNDLVGKGCTLVVSTEDSRCPAAGS